MAAKFFFFLAMTVIKVHSLKLEQVFILGRHNIRAPLTTVLQRTTSLEWPTWEVPAGHLTEKGGRLEEIMGDYFSLWFKNNGLFSEKCPDPDSIYIYSNNRQRTIETAKVFARTAFKNCNITVNFKLNAHNLDQSDPVFAPIIRNNSESFKESSYRLMREKLNQLQLEDAYAVLDQIVDIKTSDICKYDSFCDFNMKKDDILLTVGEEPNIDGPLSIANFIVDFLLMSYYNGRSDKDIAWGKIETDDDWRSLLDITKENQNVRFNQSQISKDIARPMLNFIRNTFLNEYLARKLTMLVGHDSNLNTVMAAFGFKKYNLDGQYEFWPIGGKLVFQKWRDENSNLFLKIEYVYQSMKQLRNGTALSPDNPPFTKIMEIESCKIDEKGLCPWRDFVKILKTLY